MSQSLLIAHQNLFQGNYKHPLPGDCPTLWYHIAAALLLSSSQAVNTEMNLLFSRYQFIIYFIFHFFACTSSCDCVPLESGMEIKMGIIHDLPGVDSAAKENKGWWRQKMAAVLVTCYKSKRALCCFTSETCFNLVLDSRFIEAHRAIFPCLQTQTVLFLKTKPYSGFRHTQMCGAVLL